MLTTLSNWKDVEKGENIGESFTWNNRKQYMQGVHLKKISYGIVYGIYYGYNQDRRKETRFEDDHTAMQLIKKLYNVSEDKDWDNLVPTAVLWTSEQQQQKYLNQLSSQETAKNKKLQQTNADLQQTILEQQKTITKEQETTVKLTKENKNLKKEIADFKKTISKEQEINSELNNLNLKFKQDIAELKKTISKEQQKNNELKKSQKRKQKDLNQQTEKNKKLQQTNADLQQTILEQQKTILEQQKTILEQEQTNNELTSLKKGEKMKFEQEIANLKEAINEVNLSKNNQDKFEISEINQQYETEVNKLNFKLKLD